MKKRKKEMTPKILVVDDEKSHCQMLEAVLRAEGYDISQTSDGLQAVEAVTDRFYDLILMDIRMSRMGGIEALKRIRAISPGIPIIMMTAYASVNTAVDALKSGAYDYPPGKHSGAVFFIFSSGHAAFRSSLSVILIFTIPAMMLALRL